MEYNSDFEYDLSVGKIGEKILGSILDDSTIEVKTDFEYHKTGNFYIEYQSRGKPSGISTTKAKYWALISSRSRDLNQDSVSFFLIIETEKLKRLCKKHYYRKNVLGGDSDTSVGLLIKGFDLLR